VRRKLVWSVIALAGLASFGSLFFVTLIAKERDDNFCVSCHLHQEKFKRFTSTPFTDLTGPHHAKDVRCIDCHGGADLPMQLRVWSHAALDTGKFVIGRYQEPEFMHIELRPKECTRCHTPIVKNARTFSAEEEEALEGRAGNTYHAIRPHDTVRIACTRCHTSHTTDSEPKLQFITRSRVQPICRECHKTLGE
jgi:predicted CXXCH cytochrome family protein